MFEDSLYAIRKKLVLKKNFIKLGEFCEEEDKIICYVDKKYIKKNHMYNIDLWWLGNKVPSTKAVLKRYGLDKPLCYVFDGIEFDRTVRVFAYGPSVIFKNCIFYDGINIEIGSDVTFENNMYFNKCGSYYKSDTFFKNFCNIDNLRFINDNFFNSSELISDLNKPRFGMELSLNTLEIINSNMVVSDFEVKAKKIIINNSNIEAGHVLVHANCMVSDNNSKIVANKELVVEVLDNEMNKCDIKEIYNRGNKRVLRK